MDFNFKKHCVGFTHSVFTDNIHRIPAKFSVFLIQMLQKVDPGPSIFGVFNEIRDLRYEYALSAEVLVHSVLVYSEHLLQPIMIFIDPYWLKQTVRLEETFDVM